MPVRAARQVEPDHQVLAVGRLVLPGLSLEVERRADRHAVVTRRGVRELEPRAEFVDAHVRVVVAIGLLYVQAWIAVPRSGSASTRAQRFRRRVIDARAFEAVVVVRMDARLNLSSDLQESICSTPGLTRLCGGMTADRATLCGITVPRERARVFPMGPPR